MDGAFTRHIQNNIEGVLRVNMSAMQARGMLHFRCIRLQAFNHEVISLCGTA